MMTCLCGCVLAIAVNSGGLRCEWIRFKACTRHYAQPYPAVPITTGM